MPKIVKAAGGAGQVSIGDFNAGYPVRTTWGDRIPVVDAGMPLHQYNPSAIDPLAIWKTQPNVRKVVGFAAKHFASVQWHAYKRKKDDDRERMPRSKAETLLNNPSKFVTGYSLWETLLIDKLLYDVWCVMLWPGRNGQPDQLLRVPPRLLEIKSDWLGTARKVILKNPVAGENDVDLTDAPIAINWGWHDAAAGGVSPMSTIHDMLVENRRAVQWRSHQWENSPKITGILETDKTIDQEDATRLLQSWAQWRDNPRAGGTPILQEGMTYNQLSGWTPSEAQDLEGRKLTELEVCSYYHIPPELIGSREGTYSNITAFKQMLYGPVLGPYFTEFGQAVKQLVPFLDAEPKLYVEQDRESAMAGSFAEQMDYLTKAIGGPFMSRAEGRAKLNLPYKEGTDELITPKNVTEGGQANPQDSGSQNKKPDTEQEERTGNAD